MCLDSQTPIIVFFCLVYYRWCVFYLIHPHVCFLFPQSEKNAFFVADLGVLMRQHVRWQTHMVQIRPYYAVRCNSSPAVIEVLAALGTGFICTNKVLSHTCMWSRKLRNLHLFFFHLGVYYSYFTG